MKYVDSTLYLEYAEYVGPIVTETNYKYQKANGSITVLGRGGNGNEVLIELESLPRKQRLLVDAKYGDPYEYAAKQPLLRLIKQDLAAREFYAAYRLPDGRPLKPEYQQKYSLQCDWLNMMVTVLADKATLKDMLRITMAQFWNNVLLLAKTANPNPGLPTSEKRMREKLATYKTKGYGGIIEEWRFTNDNARKVDSSIEDLIITLYAREEKPYLRQVCEEYRDFMRGVLQVVDLETGEVFDPSRYMVDGVPYEVSEATVQYYINKPANRAKVDKVRLSSLQYATTHRPYMQREAPVYAFSKITMDDTSSPFKMPDNTRPATYKVFDVASQAMVALVMHRKSRPDVALIRRMLAEMMALIVRKGWGVPYEVEVENALTSEMKGGVNKDGKVQQDVLSAGAVFPFVRFCAPRNPQEKRAEGFIKRLKHGYQRHREGFQLRPFSRLEANRMNDDAQGVKRRFSFAEIEAMEREDMELWNNTLHPDQDKYPGLTRWQVLEMHQNPALMKPDLPTIMQYVGIKTPTSVRRGYLQVQGASYRLESIDELEKFDSKSVLAYWLPDETGGIPEVYLYQDGEFVCKGIRVERFQEAKAEQTDADLHKMGRQKAYITAHDELVKQGVKAMPKVGIMRKNGLQGTGEPAFYQNEWVREDAVADELMEGVNAPNTPVETGGDVQENAANEGGYVQKNGGSLPDFLDDELARKRAIAAL